MARKSARVSPHSVRVALEAGHRPEARPARRGTECCAPAPCVKLGRQTRFAPGAIRQWIATGGAVARSYGSTRHCGASDPRQRLMPRVGWTIGLCVAQPIGMAIPDFQALMLPVLRDLSRGERTGQETLDALASEFSLTPGDIAQRQPSGKQTIFTNRVAWAKAHLKGAGLVESPRRGVYRLTDRGRSVLTEGPPKLSRTYLMRYPEYVAFRQPSSDDATAPTPKRSIQSTTPTDLRTPDDLIEDGYQQLRGALVAEIREQIAAMPPSAFEQLVVDLLLRMGYGGPQEHSGLVVGKGGDEGIDGLIKEDRLGLDTIYVQAKRWQAAVGRPDIQRFAGALQGQRARKGVFITTSSFTKEAQQYAASLQTALVLVDGAQLAELMIDHGVGVTPIKQYEIKRIDSGYFVPE